ncbi:MAG: recombinase family protein [Bacteriovoracaceae bacterium]
MKKRVAIYMRVSTSVQSTDLQEKDLTEYCKYRNLELFKTYSDHGVSGSRDNRPQLNQLMKDAYKRKFDVVLVWRFDRWARSTRHLINSLEELNQLGIEFVSYQEGIQTDSVLGKALFVIVSAIAELEKSLLAERVRSALRAAKANGKVLGRPQKINDQQVLELKEKGLSQRAIARELGLSLGGVQTSLKRSSFNRSE